MIKLLSTIARSLAINTICSRISTAMLHHTNIPARTLLDKQISSTYDAALRSGDIMYFDCKEHYVEQNDINVRYLSLHCLD